MLDTRSAHIEIKTLYQVQQNELVLRTNREGRMELALSLGRRSRTGMGMVVLKEAFRLCPYPHADWWLPNQDVLSLGDDWVIEPVGTAKSEADRHDDGTLFMQSGSCLLSLWHGPDDLAPVSNQYDLSKRDLAYERVVGTRCHTVWQLWQRRTDRGDPLRQPIFTYDSCPPRTTAVASR